MQKFRKIARVAGFAFASGLLLSTAALAAPTNLGFETTDSTGWTGGGFGPYGATDTYGAFGTADAPTPEGAYFGYVQAADQGVYTTLSQTFDLTAGQQITGYAGFRANDFYTPVGPSDPVEYNDNGYVSVNGSNLIYWDVATVGNFQISGWQAFTFTAPSDGAYTLQIGAENTGDGNFSSGTVLDGVAILSAPVPEPAGWAIMLLGVAGVGAALRRRASVSQIQA